MLASAESEIKRFRTCLDNQSLAVYKRGENWGKVAHYVCFDPGRSFQLGLASWFTNRSLEKVRS